MMEKNTHGSTPLRQSSSNTRTAPNPKPNARGWVQTGRYNCRDIEESFLHGVFSSAISSCFHAPFFCRLHQQQQQQVCHKKQIQKHFASKFLPLLLLFPEFDAGHKEKSTNYYYSLASSQRIFWHWVFRCTYSFTRSFCLEIDTHILSVQDVQEMLPIFFTERLRKRER